MIRLCGDGEFEAVLAIINDAAEAYRGIIPADRWKVPYMAKDELRHEIDAGVVFRGWEEDGELVGELVGVMGLQDLGEVVLIRHTYVKTARRGQGIGGRLLDDLRRRTESPILVGTWAAAEWAIRFYEKHGFRLVSKADKDYLLGRYWSIPERQVETSVVLVDKI